MSCILIKNGLIVNQGVIATKDILIKNGEIIKIASFIDESDCEIFDATDKYVLPGFIDTHVHFREPGLTAKADIFTESRAAAAGGVTTFFDMPNTVPQTVTIENWKEKMKLASAKSLINYAFYIGATQNNIEELIQAEKYNIPGIKLFYGSSTGNMLVNDFEKIKAIFTKTKLPIVIHSEDNDIIKQNTDKYSLLENIKTSIHPQIRSRSACYTATKKIIELAQKYNRKIHFLHISTKEEIEFLTNISVDNKLITAEVTPNHLFFDESDYDVLENKIKCNPAIKTRNDKEALLSALEIGLIDTVGTDHAPHLLSEKQKNYFDAPSGIPSIQHALNILLDFVKQKKLSITRLVEVTAHNPAKIFGISGRGFIREGFFADITIVDMNAEATVTNGNLLYKCKWSPLIGHTFQNRVVATIVNGKFVFKNNKIVENNSAMPASRLQS